MTRISMDRLRKRAALFAEARAFFAARGVLEVDTPLLADGLVVEAHIDPVPCRVRTGVDAAPRDHYLLASPEGPMKRLLAAGSGSIYQFAHAFRDGEVGRRHAPEFTMLEWYRPGFDHFALMDEVEALLRALLSGVPEAPFERVTYRELFMQGAGIDPFAVTVAEACDACARLAVPLPAGALEGGLDDVLDVLLVQHFEPQIGAAVPAFVHEYPESQAALAQVREDDAGRRVGQRFELYYGGVELANGYRELGDAEEQRRRFERANRERQSLGKAALPLDEALLAALADGFPDCSGVALGFDRVVMLAAGVADIRDVR